jgi:hypothetical protein
VKQFGIKHQEPNHKNQTCPPGWINIKPQIKNQQIKNPKSEEAISTNLKYQIFKYQILPTFAQTTIMADQQPNQLNIEISEEIAEGVYANLAIITHSHAEFVVDFVNVMPGTPKSKVKSRIILTPQHAKRFMKALVDNVKRFEAANGAIQDIEEIQIPMNFGGPTAQA